MRKTIVIMLLAVFIAACAKRNEDDKLTVVGLQGGDTVTVNVGEQFKATFMVNNARNVYAFTALVQYDTTYLRVVKDTLNLLAQEGNFLGATGDLQANLVNGIPGKLSIFYSKAGEQPGSNGDGNLWSMSFLALKVGLTAIGFDKSRSFVFSPVVLENELEKLPSRFNGQLVKTIPVVAPSDTIIVFIKIE